MGCTASNSVGSSNAVPAVSGRSNSSGRNSETGCLSSTKPYAHGSPITWGELQQQRNQFWATCTTEGDASMWAAIRAAVDALLNNDLDLANSLLLAAGITIPNGNLELCYDESGMKYRLPIYVYSNPLELVDVYPQISSASSSSRQSGGNKPSSTILPSLYSSSAISPSTSTSTSNSRTTTQNRSGGGAGGKLLKLRVRINPGDHNLNVEITNGQTVNVLKQAIEQQARVQVNLDYVTTSRQRIIFMGRELRGEEILSTIGFDGEKVLQVFVRPAN